MFLKRSTPGQSLVLPGSLRAVRDGSAVTDGVKLTLSRDGVDAPAGGKLTHVSGGAFRFAPTADDTDCDILGYVLEGPGAVTVCGSIRTEHRVDIGWVAGVAVTPSDGPLDANVTRWNGRGLAADAEAPETVEVGDDRPAPGPPVAMPDFPPRFARLAIDDDGRVKVQPLAVDFGLTARAE